MLSIDANYGRYRIVIGPEDALSSAKRENKRPIEINGEIHHIFVSPRTMRIHPSRRQVEHNMKDTVIMRDLSIHLVDPRGDGSHVEAKGNGELKARECINLAGEIGQKIIEKTSRDDHMMMAAYRIVQRDILKALKERPPEKTED
ncbi:MAG TPA: hypothetical protein PLZ86_00605 [bacterium]|nr:hypothetical protein [bacterium]